MKKDWNMNINNKIKKLPVKIIAMLIILLALPKILCTKISQSIEKHIWGFCMIIFCVGAVVFAYLSYLFRTVFYQIFGYCPVLYGIINIVVFVLWLFFCNRSAIIFDKSYVSPEVGVVLNMGQKRWDIGSVIYITVCIIFFVIMLWKKYT